MTVENRKHQTTSRLFGFRKSSVLLLTILALFVLVDQSQAKSLRFLGMAKYPQQKHQKHHHKQQDHKKQKPHQAHQEPADPEQKTQPKQEVKPEPQPAPKVEIAPEPKQEPTPQPKVQVAPEEIKPTKKKDHYMHEHNQVSIKEAAPTADEVKTQEYFDSKASAGSQSLHHHKGYEHGYKNSKKNKAMSAEDFEESIANKEIMENYKRPKAPKQDEQSAVETPAEHAMNIQHSKPSVDYTKLHHKDGETEHGIGFMVTREEEQEGKRKAEQREIEMKRLRAAGPVYNDDAPVQKVYETESPTHESQSADIKIEKTPVYHKHHTSQYHKKVETHHHREEEHHNIEPRHKKPTPPPQKHQEEKKTENPSQSTLRHQGYGREEKKEKHHFSHVQKHKNEELHHHKDEELHETPHPAFVPQTPNYEKKEAHQSPKHEEKQETLSQSPPPPLPKHNSPKYEQKKEETQSSSPPPSHKPKSNIKESKDGTISAPKYANPDHSANYKDDDGGQYSGEYLEKKLFRKEGKGALSVAMTPKNEKLLLIIGLASLFFGIFIYCICSCCQDKKKTLDQVEEDLR